MSAYALSEIAASLASHPTMPIPAYVEHTGGGVYVVRVDVDPTGSGRRDGPHLYLTPREEWDGERGVAVGLYATEEAEGDWPSGEPLRFAATLDELHALVLEGADVLSRP